MTWHVITCEYAPQLGGVADYTHVLSTTLAEAGDDVHVWCSADKHEPHASVRMSGVEVHRQLRGFGPSDLPRLGNLLDQFPAPRRLLLQWVPHGYGYKGMNLPLCLWLWRRAMLGGDHLEIIVHEPYLPFRAGGARHVLVAAVQRMMIAVLLNCAHRVWISIPGWKRLLRRYAWRRSVQFTWLPIPSVLPDPKPSVANDIRTRWGVADRPILGHFGTYSSATAQSLMSVLPPLLERRTDADVLLIGAGSKRMCELICGLHPQLACRVHATGVLDGEDVARHLAACDIVIQPYVDGVSSRRTTVMAALALGVPVVTTDGALTEPVWRLGAVSLSDVGNDNGMIHNALTLLANTEDRKRLGTAGRDLYSQRFDRRHAVASLRNAASRSVITTPREEAAAAVGSP